MSLATLPTEILLDILERLDFWALKLSLAPACRRFRDLVYEGDEYRRIDRTLFRDRLVSNAGIDTPPITGVEPRFLTTSSEIFYSRGCYTFMYRDGRTCDSSTGDYSVHPAFDLLYYHLKPSVDDVYFRAKAQGRQRLIPLPRSSAAYDNALSPAVSELVLHVSDYPPLLIRSQRPDEGVTVLQVMQGVVQVYSTLISEDNEEQGSYFPPGTTRAMNIIRGPQEYEWPGIEDVQIVDGVVHMNVPHDQQYEYDHWGHEYDWDEEYQKQTPREEVWEARSTGKSRFIGEGFL